MAVTPVGSTPSATSAYGLDFESLLKIILTQLTYQDPLKPMDNFQFVSQLAQFSQLQQSQTLNDQVTSLLGRTIDFNAGQTTVTGTVKAVSFTTGQPAVTIQTPDGNTIANISIAEISNVR